MVVSFLGLVRYVSVLHSRGLTQDHSVPPLPSKDGITPRKELQMGLCCVPIFTHSRIQHRRRFDFAWKLITGLENGTRSRRWKEQGLFLTGLHTTSGFGCLTGSTGQPMSVTWGTMWSTHTRRCGTLHSLWGDSASTKRSSNLISSTKKGRSLLPRFETGKDSCYWQLYSSGYWRGAAIGN